MKTSKRNHKKQLLRLRQDEQAREIFRRHDAVQQTAFILRVRKALEVLR